MTPEEIPAYVVAAAQEADRKGRPGDWTRVPDAQVRRLIAGAVMAERDRIADMADRHCATVPASRGALWFSTMIRHRRWDTGTLSKRQVKD